MRKLYGCKTKKEAQAKISQRSFSNETFCAYFLNLETAKRIYKNWRNINPYNQIIVDFFVRSCGKWQRVTTKKVSGYKRSTKVTSVTSS